MATVDVPASVSSTLPVASHAPTYRPELDLLRFFSFLAVFAVHTLTYPVDYLVKRHVPVLLAKIALPFVYGGAFGVDLFFVLSAYLITDLLLREKQQFGHLNIRAFYMRRILRIWPLYYVFIATVVIFPALDLAHQFRPQFLIPFLLFVGNWSFVLLGWPASIIVPLWSVSVEEQFYLLWPPLVARLTRERIVVAAWIMVASANAVRVYEIVISHSTAVHLWANTLAHLDSLAAGIGMAVLMRGRVPDWRIGNRLVLAVAAVLLFALRGYFVGEMKTPQSLGDVLGYPVVVVGCCLFLISFLGLRVRVPFLTYLGKISYGLYVYHMLAVRLAERMLPEAGGVVHIVERLLLALSLTIVISAVSYSVIEKPFLKLKRRFTFVDSRPA